MEIGEVLLSQPEAQLLQPSFIIALEGVLLAGETAG
jgi:hypothetical protein